MKRTHTYVGGERVRPMSTDVVEAENPATEQIIGEVPAGSAADVDHVALAAHPGTDMVSFTCSTEVGKQISVLAADYVEKVALELGGKSADVILDGADLSSHHSRGLAEHPAAAPA